MIYGAFLAGLLVAYLAFWPFRWDFRDLFTVAVSLFAISAFFLEAYTQYRDLMEYRGAD